MTRRRQQHGDDSSYETLSAKGHYLLLSDLHLGNGGRTDLFGQNDEAFLRMLQANSDRFEALILNGDILDAAQARHSEVIRQAHPQVIRAFQCIAQQKALYYILGNHDDQRIVHELLPAARRCERIQLGSSTLIFHGHQLDVHFADGPLAGRGLWSLRAHALIEELTGQFIRLPFCDHDSPANRFAHWLFYRLTMTDEAWAKLLSRLGYNRRLNKWAAHHDYWARTQWGDSHALLIPALQALAQGSFTTLIYGHSHQAGLLQQFSSTPTEQVSGAPRIHWRTTERRAPRASALHGRTLVNLGSWTFSETTYALWQDGQISLFDWRSQRPVDDSSYQLVLTAPILPGMREWWQRYYHGFFHYDVETVRQDRAILVAPQGCPES